MWYIFTYRFCSYTLGQCGINHWMSKIISVTLYHLNIKMHCLNRSQAIKRLWTTLVTVSACYIFFIFIYYFQQSSDIRDLSQSLIAIHLPFQCVLTKLLRGNKYMDLQSQTIKSLMKINTWVYLLGVQTTICVKPRETDIWVSGNILDHGVWEENEVVAMMKMMEMYPDATFLDIGANIGDIYN